MWLVWCQVKNSYILCRYNISNKETTGGARGGLPGQYCKLTCIMCFVSIQLPSCTFKKSWFKLLLILHIPILTNAYHLHQRIDKHFKANILEPLISENSTTQRANFISHLRSCAWGVQRANWTPATQLAVTSELILSLSCGWNSGWPSGGYDLYS